MEDIKIIWDDTFNEGDIQFADGDLIREDGLETAVMMSLFTDRRANVDDILDDPNDRRGWWADQVASSPYDKIGSRLWELDRSSTVPEVLVKAKDYTREALEWMVEDKVAKDIIVTTERGGENNDSLYIKVQILKIDDTTEEFKYDILWDAQFS